MDDLEKASAALQKRLLTYPGVTEKMRELLTKRWVLRKGDAPHAVKMEGLQQASDQFRASLYLEFNQDPETLKGDYFVQHERGLFYPERHKDKSIFFWRPSFVDTATTTVCLNNPLFFKDNRDDGIILRSLRVNEWNDDSAVDRVLSDLSLENPERFKDQHPNIEQSDVYLLQGEVEAKDSLQDWFRATSPKANLECAYRSWDLTKPMDHHTVLLGNVRMNPMLRLLYARFKSQWRVRMDLRNVIWVHGPFDHRDRSRFSRFNGTTQVSSDYYEFYDFGGIKPESPDSPPDPREQWAHVAISRVANYKGNGAITVIASNHNAAVAETVKLLTKTSKKPELPHDHMLSVDKFWTVMEQQADIPFQALFAWKLEPRNGTGPTSILAAHDIKGFGLVFLTELADLPRTM